MLASSRPGVPDVIPVGCPPPPRSYASYTIRLAGGNGPAALVAARRQLGVPRDDHAPPPVPRGRRSPRALRDHAPRAGGAPHGADGRRQAARAHVAAGRTHPWGSRPPPD